MQTLERPWGLMHWRADGPADAPALVFANSLGTDLRLWDAALPLLGNIRAIRYDKPGHGLSDRSAAVSIESLAEDAAALIEAVAGGPVVFVGLSIGGMIGQALAARRPDLVRALVLSNTAPRMGSPEVWTARIAQVRGGGMEAIAGPVMERWFAPAFRSSPALAPWRTMLARTDSGGYVAACSAIAAADLTADTAALRLPALVIAGSEDGASPPETVEAAARLIPGADYVLIPGAGHLPCVEAPRLWADAVAPFVKANAR